MCLDGFSTCYEYAERMREINQKYLCITDHGVMGAIPEQIMACEQVDGKPVPSDKKLYPIFGCLPKGSPIHTIDGVKPIEDIVEGDLVLTHRGRFRRVVSTMRRRHVGKVCRIVLADSMASSKGFLMTDEHPVLIRHEDGSANFVRADEIVAGRRTTTKGIQNWRSYVAFPKGEEGTRQFISLDDHLPANIGSDGGSFVKKLFATAKSETLVEWRNVSSTIEVCIKLASLLGFYVAEGHVRYGNDTNGVISFCFNIKEADTYAAEVSGLLSELFGLSPTIHMRPEQGSCEVITCCVPVAYLLSSLCGIGSHNKKIPQVIFASDKAVRIAFMDAMLCGDGKNPHADVNSARTLKVASLALACGFKRLLATFGEWASVATLAEEDIVSYVVPYHPDRAYARFLGDKDNVYKPIREVIHENSDLEVFNIEVDEDNSYVGSFSLHNCELYVNAMQPKVANRNESAEFRRSLGDGSTQDRVIQDGGKASPLQKKFDKSNHLLAIAFNLKGYSNLVKLTSWAWIHGYYRRPRVNHEILNQYKEGIIFTSTCASSEIAQAYFTGGDEAGFAMVEKYMAMFGENFYLELMMLDFKDQKPYDAFLIRAHAKYGIPVFLSQDCHYCKQEHSHNQQLMLLQKGKRTLADIQNFIDMGDEDGEDTLFEMQDKNLWLKSEDELNDFWEEKFADIIDYEIFKQAKANSVKIAERAKGVQFDREIKLPRVPDAEDKLWEEILRGFKKRNCPKTPRYIKQVREEYELISEKGFASYFLIQKMMVDEARDYCQRNLGFGPEYGVGCGRGCLVQTDVLIQGGKLVDVSAVKAGDKVWTIDGTQRDVKRTFRYAVNGEKLLNIGSFYSDYRGVTLTTDHKVLIEKFRRPKGWDDWSEATKMSRRSMEIPTGENLEWVQAKDVQIGDWTYTPLPKIQSNVIQWDLAKYDHTLANGSKLVSYERVAAHEFNGGLFAGKGKQIRAMERFHTLDERWALILGIFAGDGWLRSNMQPCVEYCFSVKERDVRDYVVNFFSAMGCHVSINEFYQGKQVDSVTINSKHISLLFRDLFDEYRYQSKTKHVPDCILNSDDKVVEAYLHGYFLADGSEDASRLKFVTTSPVMAGQLRFLLLRLGLPSALRMDDRADSRDEYKGRLPAYEVVCPLDVRIGSRQSDNHRNWRAVSGGILTKVSSIKQVSGVEAVYDFEVEGNHNYLTSSFLVHNSVCGSLVAYCLRLHDLDPIRHNLRFSRFLSPVRGGKQTKFRHTINPVPHENIVA